MFPHMLRMRGHEPEDDSPEIQVARRVVAGAVTRLVNVVLFAFARSRGVCLGFVRLLCLSVARACIACCLSSFYVK